MNTVCRGQGIIFHCAKSFLEIPEQVYCISLQDEHSLKYRDSNKPEFQHLATPSNSMICGGGNHLALQGVQACS